MDPIKLEELQAMKRYRRKSSFLFLLRKLIIYTLEILFMGLFLSSPLWIPKAVSFIKYFGFVFLPAMHAAVCGTKCLFLICNIIVVFLIGESKWSGSMSHDVDIYDEYVENTKRFRKISTSNESREIKEVALVEGNASGKEVEEEEEEEEEEDESDGEDCVNAAEDDSGLPAEELNKRVEEFIARIKEQRRIEARMLV